MQNQVEVMRIVRVPPLGKLVVFVGNQRFENLSEIRDPATKQRVLAAVGDLIAFAGNYQVLVDAGLAAPIAKPVEPIDQQSNQEKVQQEFLASLEKNLLTTEQSPTPTPSTFSFLTQRPRRPRPTAVNQPLNLVEQINSIFQDKVASDPDLANESVELQQSLSGGLQIVVNNKLYDQPDDIPNEKIKLALKMALKEWESS